MMTSLNRPGRLGSRPKVLGWRYLPVLLLVVGAVMRLGWMVFLQPGGHASGEIANVAMAYSQTGVLADPFRPGQGPTAHVLPFPPLYAGLIYRNLGIRSFASELVLAISAISLVMFSYGCFYRAFALVGTSRNWRLTGLALLCMLPLNFQLEVEAFRIWEGGLSVALASLFLWALLTLERRPQLGWTAIAGMSALAAALFFVSPPLGLAGYIGSLLLLIKRLPLPHWPGAIAIAVVTLALFIAPWAWRNAVVMGEALPLRSNFGLELALANHPAALGTDDPRQVFMNRLKEIHPFESDRAFAAMVAAGGEISYARQLGDTAKTWIRHHPTGFARLCATHLRDYFFPPAWLWNIYSNDLRGTAIKLAINAALSIAALAGALAAGISAWRRYRFAIIMLMVPVLPYMIVQPVLRYRYIIYALSVFFAVDLAGRMAGWVQRRAVATFESGVVAGR